MSFLPVTKQELGGQADFIIVTGDAYVDHPSFAMAILGRFLQAQGYRVGIIAQPDYRDVRAFQALGRPRLAFLVSAGNIDSMVNHYTAARKRRSQDAYSPGGRAGLRPDRATIVYCNRIRQAYKHAPILIGGIEASLRRFAHYDYWDDKVRRSILMDSGADLLAYGMGEEILLRIAARLERGEALAAIRDVPGTCYLCEPEEAPEGLVLEGFDMVAADKRAYCRAFMQQYLEQDPVRGRVLIQPHGRQVLVQNPPMLPLDRRRLDRVYALPFARQAHPMYDEPVPALAEVQFSIAANRGCFGSCSFCALTFHQGRIVQSRSEASILAEAERMAAMPEFKGNIHDVGGPTANFRNPACREQLKRGACRNRQCLFPKPCPKLEVDHRELTGILDRLRAVPGVKRVFVRSGLRYDYLLLDRDDRFFKQLVAHHVSGQLKVAPEHVCPRVLEKMGKPGREVYDRFVQKFFATTRNAGKEQYLVPYLMSSHPGSDLNAAIELAEYLRDTGQFPEQVQDFYPTPGTLSTCMYYTGLDPRTMREVYVPRTYEEKMMQRALLQYRRPENRQWVLRALRRAGREDLIGFGGKCLVRPDREPRSAEAGRRSGKQPARGREERRGPRNDGGSRPGHGKRRSPKRH